MVRAESAPELPPDVAKLPSSGEPLPVHLLLVIVNHIARQVSVLHHSGRLHLQIHRTAVEWSPEAKAVLRDSALSRQWSRSPVSAESLPRELQDILPLELPVERAQAEQRLREAGVTFDPRQIDLYQLGTLMGHFAANAGPEEYLRSIRVKQRVPAELRPRLERAWGFNGHLRYRDVDEFCSELSELLPPHAVSTVLGFDSQSGIAGKTPTSTIVLPMQLGPYELSECIGAGGMGEVYRGYDRGLARNVAIKILPKELAAHPEFVARFVAEASAAARILHPNVIPIHTIGEAGGRHYFVMPLIEGESLAARLVRHKGLPVDDALTLIDDVLAGLQAAHSQGLIHRDIKPGNILLDRHSNRAIVADFGLVKSMQEEGERTATGVVMGTVDYMSPEQGRGRPVDLRSDLYSVGVLLFQMLSGRLPFIADSPTGLIFQHVYERPAALPELVREVTHPLWAIIARLLAKSPEARYDSARSVREDLKALRQNRPLPSGTEDRDLDRFWQPVMAQSGERGSVIFAPQMDEFPDQAEALSTIGRWTGIRGVLESWWRSHRPGWVADLENTQQQVDGAIAEYRRRRDRLRSLVREAESVLQLLGDQQIVHADAAELPALIHDQAGQLATMRVRLAQVEATLNRLRAQRDLLNARLKTSEARKRLQGESSSPIPRFLTRPSPVQLMTFLALCSVLVVILKYRWQELTDFSDPGSKQRQQAPGSLQTLIRNTANTTAGGNIRLERRLTVSRDGTLAVTAQYHSELRNGQYVPVQGEIPELKAWNLSSGSELVSLAQPHISQDMTLSGDRKWLISAGSDAVTNAAEVRIWNIETGQLHHQVEGGISGSRTGLGFSPNQRTGYAIMGTPDVDHLAMIDLSSGRVTKLSMPHAADQITSAAFSPTSDEAAIVIKQSGYYGRNSIDIQDLRQKRMKISLRPGDNLHTQPVHAVAYSPDGLLLAAATWQCIYLFDTQDWTEVARLSSRSPALTNQRLAFSGNGEIIAQLRNGEIQAWDVARRAALPFSFSGIIQDFAFGAADILIAVTPQTRFNFFNMKSGKERLSPLQSGP